MLAFEQIPASLHSDNVPVLSTRAHHCHAAQYSTLDRFEGVILLFSLNGEKSPTSSLFIIIISDGACVNSLGSGNEDGSDFSFGLEVTESSSCKTSVDLKLFYN